MWGGDLSTSTDSKSHTSRPPLASLASLSVLISVITSIIPLWYSYSHSIWLGCSSPDSSWAEPSLVPWRGTNNLQVQAGETVILVNHNTTSILSTQHSNSVNRNSINEQQPPVTIKVIFYNSTIVNHSLEGFNYNVNYILCICITLYSYELEIKTK